MKKLKFASLTLGLSDKKEVNDRIAEAVKKGHLYWDEGEKVYKLTGAGKVSFAKEFIKGLKKKGD